MTIIERLEREAKRRPSAIGEGVRVALQVLQECDCSTCDRNHRDTDNPCFAARDVPFFCSKWEERQ